MKHKGLLNALRLLRKLDVSSEDVRLSILIAILIGRVDDSEHKIAKEIHDIYRKACDVGVAADVKKLTFGERYGRGPRPPTQDRGARCDEKQKPWQANAIIPKIPEDFEERMRLASHDHGAGCDEE